MTVICNYCAVWVSVSEGGACQSGLENTASRKVKTKLSSLRPEILVLPACFQTDYHQTSKVCNLEIPSSSAASTGPVGLSTPIIPSNIYSSNPSLDIDIKMSKRWDPDELKIEDALCQELDERPDWENIKNVFTDKFSLLD